MGSPPHPSAVTDAPGTIVIGDVVSVGAALATGPLSHSRALAESQAG